MLALEEIMTEEDEAIEQAMKNRSEEEKVAAWKRSLNCGSQYYYKIMAAKRLGYTNEMLEKELYAEMNQKEVADYEDFVRNKRKPIVKKGVELDYNGDTDVFFSPLASTVLDEFFTDGKN